MESAIILEELDIKTFFQEKMDILYSDLDFRRAIFSSPLYKMYGNLAQDRAGFEKIVGIYIEEAALSVSLLNKVQATKEQVILEVGGGVGFTYAFLKNKGFNIYSIEPSDSESGYDDYFSIGKKVCQILAINTNNWINCLGKDIAKLGKKFDIIFSNNVLEHIIELEDTFNALKSCLTPNGMMIHNTVNYTIPFEPHYGIPLVPFFPKLTTVFKPHLKKESLWNGLNFITTNSLSKMSNRIDLSIEFERDIMYNAVNRLITDEGFKERHPKLIPLAKLLSKTGLINLFKVIPVALTTPIIFYLKHKD